MWDAHASSVDEEPLANGGTPGSSPWKPRNGRGAAWFAKVLVSAGSLLMFCVIAWALSTSTIAGNNTEQLNWLLANPWGIVSLVDLYVGFTVFSAWIWFRENNSLNATAWTVCMMTTGWLGGCVYVLLCLRKFEGDWACFFMGNRR
jgi:cyanate permease